MVAENRRNSNRLPRTPSQTARSEKSRFHSLLQQVRPISYQETCPLRQQVLRPDLDVVYYDGDLEDTSIHLGAFVNNELVGVISMFQVRDSDKEITKFPGFVFTDREREKAGGGGGGITLRPLSFFYPLITSAYYLHTHVSGRIAGSFSQERPKG